jgi:hypothetical protein
MSGPDRSAARPSRPDFYISHVEPGGHRKPQGSSFGLRARRVSVFDFGIALVSCAPLSWEVEKVKSFHFRMIVGAPRDFKKTVDVDGDRMDINNGCAHGHA